MYLVGTNGSNERKKTFCSRIKFLGVKSKGGCRVQTIALICSIKLCMSKCHPLLEIYWVLAHFGNNFQWEITKIGSHWFVFLTSYAEAIVWDGPSVNKYHVFTPIYHAPMLPVSIIDVNVYLGCFTKY